MVGLQLLLEPPHKFSYSCACPQLNSGIKILFSFHIFEVLLSKKNSIPVEPQIQINTYLNFNNWDFFCM